MPAQGNETQRLRDLHEHYVWLVNAAVEEGREDLVWQLSDAYLAEAMQLMAEEHPSACERPGCAVCSQPRTQVPRRTSPLDWLRRRLR